MNRDQPFQNGRHEERRSAETGHQGIKPRLTDKSLDTLGGIPLAAALAVTSGLVLVIPRDYKHPRENFSWPHGRHWSACITIT